VLDSTSALRWRFSQCPIRSLYRTQAHPTPHSRKAKFKVGKRRVTPPMNRALHNASEAAAKCPIWVHIELEIEVRAPQPNPCEWKPGTTLSSTHFAQTGS
jgi:hypothetical protein